MAFSEPNIHRVSKVSAELVNVLPGSCCLVLSFTQSRMLSTDGTLPAVLGVYGDADMYWQFLKVADAINAAFAEPETVTEAA